MELPDRLQQRIYDWIKVEGLTTAEIATMLSLPEAQIEAICTRYDALPSSSQAVLLPPRELVLKEWELHDKRLAFLYQTAMSAWRASAETRSVQRRGKGGSVEFVTEVQRGQARYLAIAARLSREQALACTALAKLREEWAVQDAATGRAPEAIADDARVLAPIGLEPSPTENDLAASESATSPPIGVLAPSEGENDESLRDAAESVDVTSSIPIACAERSDAGLASAWSANEISNPMRADAVLEPAEASRPPIRRRKTPPTKRVLTA